MRRSRPSTPYLRLFECEGLAQPFIVISYRPFSTVVLFRVAPESQYCAYCQQRYGRIVLHVSKGPLPTAFRRSAAPIAPWRIMATFSPTTSATVEGLDEVNLPPSTKISTAPEK